MKVFFAGGGTLGPVIPLLALSSFWKEKDPMMEFCWAGTCLGSEKKRVESAHIPFFSFPIIRWRRYPSWEWFTLPYRLCIAFLFSWNILRKEKPNIIASAGGFTTFPLVFVGCILGIPSWVHQQDMVPSITTRLSLPFVTSVTVAWESLLVFFPKQKTKLLGNPVREIIQQGDRHYAQIFFDLYPDRPTLFVIGGGTGSEWINQKIIEIADDLCQTINIIHVTGIGKIPKDLSKPIKGYAIRESLENEIAHAFAIADLILSRAGMGLISECASLRKPVIFIPLPHSPQEQNAYELEKQKAALVLHQEKIGSKDLKKVILSLLEDRNKRDQMSQQIHQSIKTNIIPDLIDHLEKIMNSRLK
jgi:UDP-N-acetylglucosamine--N-acetylmuramyl-(pentapeptide) pyrophosphoryl-undecaprenol N-acetylglucosamine transferase